MKKIAILTVVSSLMAGAFVAGVAVGKGEPAPKAKFIANEEVKWDDLGGGPKLAALTGDYAKGPFGALLKLPAGFTSPLHSHTGTYEAVEISGTSSHWLKGEDGTKAKKMTPGSYWTINGKTDHVSACATGTDCVIFVWQKTKFDFVPGKEDKAVAGAAAGSAAGAAAPAATTKASVGAGSAAAPAASKAGTAAAPAASKAGTAVAPATGPATAPKAGAGAAAGSAAPKK